MKHFVAPCLIIFLKSDYNLGLRYSNLRVHLMICRISENIAPQNILGGILLSMKGILTISKEQKHLFCRLAYKQKHPLFQYQGLKNVA